MGCEVASLGEMRWPCAGIPARPDRLRLPAKTRAEIALAIEPRHHAERRQLPGTGAGRRRDAPAPGSLRSVIGLRVNPQVGVGSIAAMSTATRTSKFGIALDDAGAVRRFWKPTAPGRG